MNDSTNISSPVLTPQVVLTDCLQALRRNAALAAFVFVVIVASVVVLLMFLPKTYLSYAKLYIKVGRESVTLDPTATMGQTMSITESRENEINSVLEILSSENIYDAVVARVGADAILKDQLPEEDLAVASIPAKRIVLTDEITHNSSHREAVRKLQEDLSLDAVKRASIINASCKAKSPELAQLLLQSFIDEAIQAHITSNRTTGSFDFFDEQYTLLEKKFNVMAGRLSKKKSELGVASLDERQRNLQKLHSELELQYHNTYSSLAEVKARVEGLNSQLNSMPKDIETGAVTGFPNDGLGTTETRLFAVELQLQQMRTKYSENNPIIISLKQEKEKAEQLLAAGGDARYQATRGMNPVYQQISQRRAEQEAEAVSLESKLSAINSQMSDVQSKLNRLNEGHGELTELQQQYDVLQESLLDYSKKREQARIDMALETERITNINVIQPPSYSDKSVSASRKVILMLAMVFAGGFAILVAIGKDLIPKYAKVAQSYVLKPHPAV